jgi:hypothetical protein
MVPTLSSEPAPAPPPEAGVTYRELAVPPRLAPWVRCLWELTVQGDGPGWIVPDGFMDLVASGPEVTLAGPDTRPWPVRRRAGVVAVGVRFHPGAAPALLGPPASELRDLRVTPDALWGRAGRELAERVGEAPSPAARLEAMVAGLGARLDGAAPPDPLVAAAVARLERDPGGGARVAALGPAVGSASGSCAAGSWPRSATAPRPWPGCCASSACCPCSAPAPAAARPAWSRPRTRPATPTRPT